MNPILVSLDFDFFVYRNPKWNYAFPLDSAASANDWKRRVGYVYHSMGQNLRAKSNLVAEIDGIPQIQPEDFLDHLKSQNVVIPEDVMVYGSEFRRFAYSAAFKIKELTGKPVDLVHFGTAHGFRPFGKQNKSTDATCSDSWHACMARDGLVENVTLVFPEWQRKIVELSALGLQDEQIADLPEGDLRIREMFFNDWKGFAEETTITGFFGAREGALVPPWLDMDYLAFMSRLPGTIIKQIGDPERDPKPHVPREWTDTPPDPEELSRMKEAPKKVLEHTDPAGITVLYNGRLVPIR